MRTLIFAPAHYAALAVFVASCWGWGRTVLARFSVPGRRDVWLDAGLAITAGIGMFIGVFQALGIAGLFTRTAVLALVALGVVAAIWQWPALLSRRAGETEASSPASWVEKFWMAVLALTIVTTLASPLAPPVEWDELAYHLPYAREVARSGSPGIYEWLRYPWFPYNYELLYAGALMAGSDVFAHLLHALAGWTAALIVHRLGALYIDRVVACVGAAIWLRMADFTSAYIDNGVALFVLAACVALWRWHESPPDGARWLALAAFFLGIAVGSKYQALTMVLLLGVFALWRERRPGVLAAVLLCFLLPCVYWYARNAIMTGDPFNPIGGAVFGFTNWNAEDLRLQFQDLRGAAGLPSALIWAVLAAPFSVYWKRSPALRAAGVFCVYALVVWGLTSRYPRYLMLASPLLALTAAVGWQTVFSGIAARLRRMMAGHGNGLNGLDRAGRWLAVLLLAVALGPAFVKMRQRVSMIAVTPEQRDAVLRERVPGYAAMNYMREHARGRVYHQLSSAVYYGPSPVWGDSFGPWRYADFLTLAPADLARKLAGQGFEAIAVPLSTATRLEAQPGFHENFALMYEASSVRARSGAEGAENTKNAKSQWWEALRYDMDNARTYRIRQYRHD